MPDLHRGKEKVSKWKVEWGLLQQYIPRFRSVSKPEFIFKEERLISMSTPYDTIAHLSLDIWLGPPLHHECKEG